MGRQYDLLARIKNPGGLQPADVLRRDLRLGGVALSGVSAAVSGPARFGLLREGTGTESQSRRQEKTSHTGQV